MAEAVGDPAGRSGRASNLELLESVLCRAEGVRSVAVVRRDDTPVAYLVPATVDLAALRAHVAASLPGVPVPELAAVAALPLTPDGRVDRAALSAPGYTVPTATGYVAPRTEAERILAGVCAQVLGVGRVGVEDNFFDLSGDSVDTILLVAKAKEAGLQFTAQDVFQLKTVAAIAAASGVADPADQAPGVPAGPPLVALSQQEIDAIEAKWR